MKTLELKNANIEKVRAIDYSPIYFIIPNADGEAGEVKLKDVASIKFDPAVRVIELKVREKPVEPIKPAQPSARPGTPMRRG